MKEVVNNMIAHPIKTSFIIGAIGLAISDIIRAAKGQTGTPVLNLIVSKPSRKESKES